jgi:hypothetical protein
LRGRRLHLVAAAGGGAAPRRGIALNLPDPIDFANLAEEIESLGASQLHEFYSRCAVLLLDLLQGRYQPEKRSPSWGTTIRKQ